NATEAINLVAYTWGRKFLQPGDLVILTEMEHHANLVPWQLLAAEREIRLEFIPVREDGLLNLEEYDRLLEQKPKLVSFTHMSNVLGTINPAEEIIRKAHEAGAVTLVDGAQSVPHFAVDVQKLGADFLAFSAHKMCGPTGIGVLYGRQELLEAMPPFLGGGDMIKKVELRSFQSNAIPHKFEAGTPAIAEAVGLAAAIDYLQGLGMEA
ncbi:MAG TPA: aminotransferase class V-fold PLP-dependent enzyme, partial [Anaerolineaceae bacterium]|nr:aminotransferase class V-fold PLP-dependent enzyme [Anaerolineaceae bacterium]